MKEVMAVIRPHKWQTTKKKLLELGISSYTVLRVYGRGRQKGLQYLNRNGPGTIGMRTIPKRLIWLWLQDDQVQNVVQTLIESNKTGQIGDGKIFICPLENAMRLRTGEMGLTAVA